jgi:hypothetical protein
VEVELQKKLSMMREKNKWLMQALASFIDAHYPPIARQVSCLACYPRTRATIDSHLASRRKSSGALRDS